MSRVARQRFKEIKFAKRELKEYLELNGFAQITPDPLKPHYFFVKNFTARSNKVEIRFQFHLYQAETFKVEIESNQEVIYAYTIPIENWKLAIGEINQINFDIL